MELLYIPNDIISIILNLIDIRFPYDNIDCIKSLVSLALTCNQFQCFIIKRFDIKDKSKTHPIKSLINLFPRIFISKTIEKVNYIIKYLGYLSWIPNIRKAWNEAKISKYTYKLSWNKFIDALIILLVTNQPKSCDSECSHCSHNKRVNKTSIITLRRYKFVLSFK